MVYFVQYGDEFRHQIPHLVFCGKQEFKTVEYNDKIFQHFPQLSMWAFFC